MHITLPPRTSAQGFRIVPREQFLSEPIEIACFTGATSMTAQEIEAAHAQVSTELRERAARFSGTHVIYDPQADSEGWLLVGEADSIIQETEQMLSDLEP